MSIRPRTDLSDVDDSEASFFIQPGTQLHQPSILSSIDESVSMQTYNERKELMETRLEERCDKLMELLTAKGSCPGCSSRNNESDVSREIQQSHTFSTNDGTVPHPQQSSFAGVPGTSVGAPAVAGRSYTASGNTRGVSGASGIGVDGASSDSASTHSAGAPHMAAQHTQQLQQQIYKLQEDNKMLNQRLKDLLTKLKPNETNSAEAKLEEAVKQCKEEHENYKKYKKKYEQQIKQRDDAVGTLEDYKQQSEKLLLEKDSEISVLKLQVEDCTKLKRDKQKLKITFTQMTENWEAERDKKDNKIKELEEKLQSLQVQRR